VAATEESSGGGVVDVQMEKRESKNTVTRVVDGSSFKLIGATSNERLPRTPAGRNEIFVGLLRIFGRRR